MTDFRDPGRFPGDDQRGEDHDMTRELREQSIRRRVVELIEIEGELAGMVDRAQQLLGGHSEALAAVMRLRPMIQEHQKELALYLKDTGGAVPSGDAKGRQFMSEQATTVPEVLRDLCMVLHHCALSSAILYEVALRLYEPRLRQLAPKHMEAYADAALSTARLLPGVVASQLAKEGLAHCECICPMCGLGACGCVNAGTDALIVALRGTVPVDSGSKGFVLLPPKPNSALALKGVQGGDLLLSIDGRQVRNNTEIQEELRKRKQGDDVTVLIQHGSEAPREFSVRYPGDYPTA